MRWSRGPLRLLPLLLSLAACAPRPPSAAQADARCGGGAPAPWCNGTFPGDDPPASEAERREVVMALAAACPPPAADDPTPGLSAGARRPEGVPEGVRCVIRAPAAQEAAALSRILAVTPREAQERAEVVDRLAAAYFRLERESYQECRAMQVPERPSRSALAVAAGRARAVIGELGTAQREARSLCAELRREHPEHRIRAACEERGAAEEPADAAAQGEGGLFEVPSPGTPRLTVRLDAAGDDAVGLSRAVLRALGERMRRSGCCDNPGPYRCHEVVLRVKLRVEADGRILKATSADDGVGRCFARAMEGAALGWTGQGGAEVEFEVRLL